MAMPVSTRDRGDDAANRFAPARVLVPIQPADDPERCSPRSTTRLGDGEAAKPALGALDEPRRAASRSCPTSLLVAFTRSQTRTIDFAASNLRGSPVPLYLAGARIDRELSRSARAAGTALNVTMLELLRRAAPRAATSTRPRSPTSTAFMSDLDACVRRIPRSPESTAG